MQLEKSIVNYLLDHFPVENDYLIKNLDIEGETNACPLYRATFRSSEQSAEYLEWHFLQLGTDRIAILRAFSLQDPNPRPYFLVEMGDIFWFGCHKEGFITCNLVKHAQLLYQFSFHIDLGHSWYPTQGELDPKMLELLNQTLERFENAN